MASEGRELLAMLQEAVGDQDGLASVRTILGSPAAPPIALVSSMGAESAVLLDMVATAAPATPVIFLDTGKLFPETLAYQRELCRHLRLTDVRRVTPQTASLERFDENGDLHGRDRDLCCHLRKTEPLELALEGFAGWITGRKQFQGGARTALPVLELEPTTGRVKINPLARWSLEDIRHYRRLRQLPLHPLQSRGYSSIGCAPCTTPSAPGEPPRAGRWRGIDKLECGIH